MRWSSLLHAGWSCPRRRRSNLISLMHSGTVKITLWTVNVAKKEVFLAGRSLCAVVELNDPWLRFVYHGLSSSLPSFLFLMLPVLEPVSHTPTMAPQACRLVIKMIWTPPSIFMMPRHILVWATKGKMRKMISRHQLTLFQLFSFNFNEKDTKKLGQLIAAAFFDNGWYLCTYFIALERLFFCQFIFP